MEPKRKALFLDRDGTLNVERNYLYRTEDFELMPGICDAMREARDCGFDIVVITNQSGIARGYYTEEDYQRLEAHMKAVLLQEGISLLDVLHCPLLEGPDRKPEPGMFLRACQRWGIDMAHSISLGDKERDIEAALRAGVGCNVLLSAEAAATRATHVIGNAHEMVSLIRQYA